MFILYDDDHRVLGLFSTKEKLNHAMNGHEWGYEEMLADTAKQILPIWEVTINPNGGVESIGPYYHFVDEGYTNMRTSLYHEGVRWLSIQAETKDQAIEIARNLINVN